jgi:uncharacterized coiled-coil protein SlyX
MFTADERLKNLEAGLVNVANTLYDVPTLEEKRTVVDEIRERIKVLYQRIAATRHILATAQEICESVEAD